MFKFILKRLLIAVPMILVMALLTFILMQKTAGSYYDLLKMDPLISPQTIGRYVQLYLCIAKHFISLLGHPGDPHCRR